jgi:tetratricopeptide (TPR) repeat protein
LTDEYLGMNPGDAKAWQSRGLALAYLGMKEEAAKAFEKSLEILNVSLNEDPKDSEAWWLKAEDLELLERGDIALEAYDKIINLNSSKVIEAWLRKSDIFSGQPGGYNQSKEAFDNAIDLIVADSKSPKNDTSCKFMSFWYNEGDHIIAENISIENGRIAMVNFVRHNLSLQAYDNVIQTLPASNPQTLKNATSSEFMSFWYNESGNAIAQNMWMVNDQIVRVDFVRYNSSIQAYDDLVQTYLTCNPFAAWQSKSKAIDYRQGTNLEQREYIMGLSLDPSARVNWVYYDFSKAYLPGNNSSTDLKEVPAEESADPTDAVVADN